MDSKSMRNLWFEHVAKTRKKIGTKKKPCSHREAMRRASETWSKTKSKILRARAKAAKNKAVVVPPSQPPAE